ncbi:uncharacterized protein LOC131649473 [Vicia villosa]|uniref:uncharacterized protein LOC131649473 n=1 Tax=Vicia villosa TaxID=3911 RepID=UPI00273C19DF|nr:uncharacterized protein LOC131649473 [Vicia villosa]
MKKYDSNSVASQKEVPALESQQMTQKISSVPNKKRDLPRTVERKPFVPRFRMCLETLVGTSYLMNGATRQMDMEEGIFGFSCSETIAKEEMEQIFQHTELGISVVHSYIRVNEASIVQDPDSLRYHLVERFMAINTKSLYLLPYNIIPVGRHWLLVVIDRFKEVVYYQNSVDGEWKNYPDMKSIQIFRSQRKARVSRSRSSNITWIKVECAQQRNNIDCGYFVLRFMKEILHLNLIEILITYFDEYKCALFTKNQLEEIKEELCEYFIDCPLVRFWQFRVDFVRADLVIVRPDDFVIVRADFGSIANM